MTAWDELPVDSSINHQPCGWAIQSPWPINPRNGRCFQLTSESFWHLTSNTGATVRNNFLIKTLLTSWQTLLWAKLNSCFNWLNAMSLYQKTIYGKQGMIWYLVFNRIEWINWKAVLTYPYFIFPGHTYRFDIPVPFILFIWLSSANKMK